VRGFFADMDREKRRAWCDEQISEQRAAYLASQGAY
jgi:hypothetical protein